MEKRKKSGGKTITHPGQRQRGMRQPNQHGQKIIGLPTAGRIKTDSRIKYKKCPPFPSKRLSGHAKEFWAEHAKRMHSDGRLNRETRQLFEMLASAYDRWVVEMTAKTERHFYKLFEKFIVISEKFGQPAMVATDYSSEYD